MSALSKLATCAATARRLLMYLALACALALVATSFVTPRTAHAVGVCAGGVGGPCIEWQANGSGFLGGPAGTRVTVIGGGFTAAEGQSIVIGLVQGDDIYGTSPSPSFCAASPVNTGVTATVSGGQFTVSFDWPSGLIVGDWSACAYIASSGALAGGDGVGNTDNAAFDCTSPNPPTVSVSPTRVIPGAMVTVTGQGWLPDMNTIVVRISTCSTCNPPIANYGNAESSGSNGVFSVQLTIPTSTAPGPYLVWGYATAVPVTTSLSGPYLTVVSSLAPTATPSSAPTATPSSPPHATATPKPGGSGPTATAKPKAGSTATASTVVDSAGATPTTPAASFGVASRPSLSHSGGTSPWLFVGIAVVVVLLGGAGAFYFLRRRSGGQV